MLSFRKTLLYAFSSLAVFCVGAYADAARMSVSPAGGTFVVGGTFDISILLDTENESINAIQAVLLFPPDKLQLVSSTTGRSIIEIWTAHPKSNNTTGIVDLQGGITNGINVKNGLITTLTFRAKATGTTFLRFSDKSKVLANDGAGTNVLNDSNNGVYSIILPPPAGPIVASDTHPDQSVWYPNSDVILRWSSEETEYSYVLNREPTSTPDNISEGKTQSISYSDLSDGIHYFHIKALRGEAWGGITHFAINVDATSPAEFPIKIEPSSRTSSKTPVIKFATTDSLSGIDYYELKIIPLKPANGDAEDLKSDLLFIEAQSPYIGEFELGSYDIIIRVYDISGNFRETTERLNVVRPIFEIIRGEGIRLADGFTIPWILVWIIISLILIILIVIAVYVGKWHGKLHRQQLQRDMPSHVKDQLKELKKYRSKYGKISILLLVVSISSFLFAFDTKAVHLNLDPPVVTTVSENITNEDIFYIGGRSNNTKSRVIIYLQNLHTGETTSDMVPVDEDGEWFYRHPSFLSSGNYYLWVQSQIGEETSPPSPQISMQVHPTALQIGSSRISRETLYLGITVMLLAIIAILSLFILFSVNQAKKKRKIFLKEVQEAEEAIRRGFAVLRRDLEAELKIIHQARMNKELSDEEKKREAHLLKDMESIEKNIGKEVWDIEKYS